jgi:hypothetical protein
MERVELTPGDPAAPLWGLAGPRAAECAARIAGAVPSVRLGAGGFEFRGDPPAGLATIGPETLEILRIEDGFPRWGADMGADELPMEAGLTELAVSYTKGCYLGQEVILRLRNFGELPRQLRLLEIEGDAVPAPGTPIDEGGKVTSACRVPATGRVLALGYVKKGHVEPGARVTVAGRPAVVRRPPFQERIRSSPA